MSLLVWAAVLLAAAQLIEIFFEEGDRPKWLSWLPWVLVAIAGVLSIIVIFHAPHAP